MKIFVEMPAVHTTNTFLTPENVTLLESLGEVTYNKLDRHLTVAEMQDALVDVDVLVGGWGLPKLTGEVLAKANKLKIEASIYSLEQTIFEVENEMSALLGIVPMKITRSSIPTFIPWQMNPFSGFTLMWIILSILRVCFTSPRLSKILTCNAIRFSCIAIKCS